MSKGSEDRRAAFRLRLAFAWAALALAVVFGSEPAHAGRGRKAGAEPVAAIAREDDPIWKTFVVGKVGDLPDCPIKTFLHDAHFNNPYAATIVEKTKKLGPFAPEADNIFWIPTIDMPMTKENWRFLSSLDDLPGGIKHLTTYTRGEQTYVRMFLHPYTIQEPSFMAMAAKFGGFKYEFQGSTTASVRSLIAWKVGVQKPVGAPGVLEFPLHDPTKFLWPKVSVTRADIDGSRLNPAKKMVRAYAVTREMNEIPSAKKAEIGFQFAGEWLVGVPNGTDAGFVTREVLAAYLNQLGHTVEPGFTVFSPKRLSEMTAGMEHPEEWIREKLVRPMFRTMAYLLMEEGMIGEYHNQNFNYVIGADGRPTGEVLLHDADAFRTSILLRTMEGKSTAAISKIDVPFFYMKDGIFTQSANSAAEYGMNALVNDYFANPKTSDSVAGFVQTWCKAIPKFRRWCTAPQLKKLFTDTFAEELATYVGHPIPNLELGEPIGEGKVGLLALFKERMAKVADESALYRSTPNPDLQKVLYEEYSRLVKVGRGRTLAGKISLADSNFFLEVKDGNTVIHVVSKKEGKANRLKGVALLAMNDDPAAVEFAKRVEEISGIEIPMGAVGGVVGGYLSKPWMQDMGGGNNISTSTRDYLAARDQRTAGVPAPPIVVNCPGLVLPP